MKIKDFLFPFFLLLFLAACNNGDDTNDIDDDDDDDPTTVKDNSFVSSPTYKLVETNQTGFYNNTTTVSTPSSGDDFYGQDGTYTGNSPQYVDNGNGTITDMVTGLMWQQDAGSTKMTYYEGVVAASSFNLADYTDWRLPTIKELYSLIMFSGIDISGYSGTSTSGLTPFLNTDYFEFEYGDLNNNERLIDSQYLSSNMYVGDTEFASGELVFGVNLADGRIKGYPPTKDFFVFYVRGNSSYGVNSFSDNGDGTISDANTNLMWMQDDNGSPVDWENAISYAENLSFGGYDDWRLPNIKELQSILDYSRSPYSTNSAAINALFNVTSITNEENIFDYPFYWSGTTHLSTMNGTSSNASNAAYMSFGRALGYFNSSWMDVHGAGAQRSDPKTGDPADYPAFHGPQGDVQRVFNYARAVRDVNQ